VCDASWTSSAVSTAEGGGEVDGRRRTRQCGGAAGRLVLPVGMPCCGTSVGYRARNMVKLADVQKDADKLSTEDKEGLLAHLLHSLEGHRRALTTAR
jgi:hypothetical protein